MRLSILTSEQGQLDEVAQGHQVLKISRDGVSTVFLGNLFQFSVTLKVKKKKKVPFYVQIELFFIRGNFYLLHIISISQAFSCPWFCLP